LRGWIDKSHSGLRRPGITDWGWTRIGGIYRVHVVSGLRDGATQAADDVLRPRVGLRSLIAVGQKRR